MGLLTRRPPPPPPRPDVERRILVEARPGAVAAHLHERNRLAGPRVPDVPLRVRRSGGWTSLELPPDVHPWAFHDLARWLLQLAPVVAVSGPDGGRDGYWLVDDPADDLLSGYHDDGTSITVAVSTNDVTRGDPLDRPVRTLHAVLDEMEVPDDLRDPDGGEPVPHLSVRVDDPGVARNPGNHDTVESRRGLVAHGSSVDVV